MYFNFLGRSSWSCCQEKKPEVRISISQQMRNNRNSVFVIGLIFNPIKLIGIHCFPITLIRIKINQISANI